MILGNIVGQDRALGLLLRAIERGRVPHAYLFDGPAGVGKRSAAVGLGMALNCATAPGRGCGQCDVCHRILAGNHPDVRVIVPATAQILIDQAQEIVKLAAERPHEAPARVIALDDADRLNANAANCLLKTLEEPFAGNHLVLVSSAPDRLLSTIRSRTQRIRFLPVRADVLTALATARGIEPERAELAAALAGGSVARLWDQLDAGDAADSTAAGGKAQATWEIIANLRRAAAAPDVGAIFDAATAVGDKENKEGLPEVIELLGRFYRDALATATGAHELVLLRERAADLERLAQVALRHHDLGPLRRALAAVVEADTALAANANTVLAVERMLLEMRPYERAAAG